MKILLADDEIITTEIMKEILTLLKFDIITVKNGLELLEYIKNHPKEIDLIITDLNMPTMNGYSAATICKHHLNHNIPIIAITALKEILDITPFDNILHKPINIQELTNILNTINIQKGD